MLLKPLLSTGLLVHAEPFSLYDSLGEAGKSVVNGMRAAFKPTSRLQERLNEARADRLERVTAEFDTDSDSTQFSRELSHLEEPALHPVSQANICVKHDGTPNLKEREVNGWSKPSDHDWARDIRTMVDERCEDVEEMDDDGRDTARDILGSGTMDNAFQQWLDESADNDAFVEKATSEIPSLAMALGVGIILCFITGLFWWCYCYQWCSQCCRPCKRERGHPERNQKLMAVGAWGLVAFILFVLCCILLEASVRMTWGFDTLFCRSSQFYSNMVSGSGAFRGLLAIVESTKTLHNKVSSCQTDFKTQLDANMSDTATFDMAIAQVDGVLGGYQQMYEQLQESISAVDDKVHGCIVCEALGGKASDSNDLGALGAARVALSEGLPGALDNVKESVRTSLMGGGLEGLRGAFHGLGTGLSQMMREGFIDGPLTETFVSDKSQENKDLAGEAFGGAMIGIGSIWIVLLCAGAFVEALFFFMHGYPAAKTSSYYEEDGTMRYNVAPARAASFMWCTTCFCVVIALFLSGFLGIINFFTASLCLQMDGMTAESVNDVGLKVFNSGSVLEKQGKDLWNRCFTTGGDGLILEVFKQDSCPRAYEYYNNGTRRNDTNGNGIYAEPPRYPACTKDQEVKLSVREILVQKTRAQLDSSFSSAESTPESNLAGNSTSMTNLKALLGTKVEDLVGLHPDNVAALQTGGDADITAAMTHATAKKLFKTQLNCQNAQLPDIDAFATFREDSEGNLTKPGLYVGASIPGIETVVRELGGTANFFDAGVNAWTCADATPGCGAAGGAACAGVVKLLNMKEALRVKNDFKRAQVMDGVGECSSSMLRAGGLKANATGCLLMKANATEDENPYVIPVEMKNSDLSSLKKATRVDTLQQSLLLVDEQSNLVSPQITGGLKTGINLHLMDPLEKEVVDGMNCKFMMHLWNGLVDGFCFQTVVAMVQVGQMLLGMGITGWFYILTLYGIWRVVKDNIYMRDTGQGKIAEMYEEEPY